MGTIYGCQNANQEECYKYTDWEKWKSGTCVWLEGFGFYCDDESDEGGDGGDDGGDNGDGGCGEGMAAVVVAATMIATTVVIR